MNNGETATNIPDPLANYMSVNLNTAYDLVIDCFNARRVVELISSPGIGKSSLIKQVAKSMEFLVVDVRLSTIDPTELNGFPHVHEVNGRKVASFIPMDIFPVVGSELPINPDTDKPYKGWVLFLDEWNAAPNMVQAAAYKLILDRMVGMFELDDRCVMATAGNLSSDRALVSRLSTAMQSRVAHLAIRVCHDSFHAWADKNGIDHRVKSFLKFKPALLHRFVPDHDDLTFPCPRTWEFMSDILKPYDPIPMSKLPLMAGIVGKGAARDYHAHTEVVGRLPTMSDIIRDPRNVHFDREPGIEWGLAGMVGANIKHNNAKECIDFLSRLGADHQVAALRSAIARDFSLYSDNTAVSAWLEKYTEQFIQRR
jgi:hypothetical protein